MKRDEQGTTILEVVTTLFLLSVFLGFVYAGIDSMRNALEGVERRTTNLNEARILMASMTKDLRLATYLEAGDPAFELADDREVIFYANLNPTNGPKRIRLYVDSQSQLLSEVQEPDVGSVAPNYTYTGTPEVRYVGRYVANTASQPLFIYLDDQGAELTATPLSSADRLRVNSIRIDLRVKKSTTLAIATTSVVNTVRLPNLQYQEVVG